MVTETEHAPLIVTADAILRAELMRLAVAGGVEPTVASGAEQAAGAWSGAPFVLLGIDAVAGCVGLPRRAGLIMVVRGTGDQPPWHEADQLRAEQVAILPAAQAWLLERFCDHAHGSVARARVIAVLGGRGGSGASVLAAGLAITGRRRGLDTLLIDADPLGGGVDLVLGWERMEGLRWPELVDARGRVNPPALVRALPRSGSLAILSFDRRQSPAVPAEAMAAALDAGRRGRDLVVVDLPRSFDDASVLALTAADRAYLVVPAELRACAAARQVAALATRYCPALALVVRKPAPGGLGVDEVADAVSLPLAGELPSEPGLAQGLERGAAPASSGRGPLAELCRSLLGGMTAVARR